MHLSEQESPFDFACSLWTYGFLKFEGRWLGQVSVKAADLAFTLFLCCAILQFSLFDFSGFRVQIFGLLVTNWPSALCGLPPFSHGEGQNLLLFALWKVLFPLSLTPRKWENPKIPKNTHAQSVTLPGANCWRLVMFWTDSTRLLFEALQCPVDCLEVSYKKSESSGTTNIASDKWTYQSTHHGLISGAFVQLRKGTFLLPGVTKSQRKWGNVTDMLQSLPGYWWKSPWIFNPSVNHKW